MSGYWGGGLVLADGIGREDRIYEMDRWQTEIHNRDRRLDLEISWRFGQGQSDGGHADGRLTRSPQKGCCGGAHEAWRCGAVRVAVQSAPRRASHPAAVLPAPNLSRTARMAAVSCPLIAVGANRHPAAADWSPCGLLAFGAGRCIALWNPLVRTPSPRALNPSLTRRRTRPSVACTPLSRATPTASMSSAFSPAPQSCSAAPSTRASGPGHGPPARSTSRPCGSAPRARGPGPSTRSRRVPDSPTSSPLPPPTGP